MNTPSGPPVTPHPAPPHIPQPVAQTLPENPPDSNPAPNQDHPHLKRQTIHAAAWTIAGHGTALFIRLASNLVLTRLLAPEVFGLMAIVQTLRVGLAFLSDIGLQINVIRSPRGEDPRFLNTVWTLQVLRGLLLSLAILLLSWPVSLFYKDPRLIPLLALITIDCVFAGLNSTSLALLTRRLDVVRQVRFEIGTQLMTLAITLLWVAASPSIWSLMYGGLCGSALRFIWSHLMKIGPKNHFDWDQSAAQEIMSIGSWILLSSTINFLADQSDRLILGKLLAYSVLGVYNIIATLADVPRQICLVLSAKVILPVASRISHLPRHHMRASILKHRRAFLLVAAIGTALSICCGDLLVQLLYDKRYESQAWIMPILCLGLWPRILCSTVEGCLMAIGQVQYVTYANSARFFFKSAGIILGFHSFGLPGAMIALALSDIPYYAITAWGLNRCELSVLAQDIKATAFFLAALAALCAIRYSSGWGWPLQSLPIPWW